MIAVSVVPTAAVVGQSANSRSQLVRRDKSVGRAAQGTWREDPAADADGDPPADALLMMMMMLLLMLPSLESPHWKSVPLQRGFRTSPIHRLVKRAIPSTGVPGAPRSAKLDTMRSWILLEYLPIGHAITGDTAVLLGEQLFAVTTVSWYHLLSNASRICSHEWTRTTAGRCLEMSSITIQIQSTKPLRPGMLWSTTRQTSSDSSQRRARRVLFD